MGTRSISAAMKLAKRIYFDVDWAGIGLYLLFFVAFVFITFVQMKMDTNTHQRLKAYITL
jgi:hypothetical protein